MLQTSVYKFLCDHTFSFLLGISFHVLTGPLYIFSEEMSSRSFAHFLTGLFVFFF